MNKIHTSSSNSDQVKRGSFNETLTFALKKMFGLEVMMNVISSAQRNVDFNVDDVDFLLPTYYQYKDNYYTTFFSINPQKC